MRLFWFVKRKGFSMEKLKYLFTNPYTWLFIVFVFALPYVLKYIRRFYSKELQKKMEKEDACMLEANQRPEMKIVRRNALVGIVLSVGISYIISYHLMELSCDSLKIFTNIFSVLISFVVVYMIVAEHKINKGKKDKICSKIYTKREIIMQIGIYGGLVVLLFAIIVMSGIGKIR